MTKIDDLKTALDRVGEVLEQNQDEHDVWRDRAIGSHLDHAAEHIRKARIGDKSEDHLAHATTRMLMALALDLAARS